MLPCCFDIHIEWWQHVNHTDYSEETANTCLRYGTSCTGFKKFHGIIFWLIRWSFMQTKSSLECVPASFVASWIIYLLFSLLWPGWWLIRWWFQNCSWGKKPSFSLYFARTLVHNTSENVFSNLFLYVLLEIQLLKSCAVCRCEVHVSDQRSPHWLYCGHCCTPY